MLSKKTLKFEEEMEMLHKNLADGLDMISPHSEMRPTIETDEYQATNQLGGQLKVMSRGLMSNSKSWSTLEKKLEANYNNLQNIQSENDKIKEANQELLERLEFEKQRTSMLDKEIEVLRKEKGFYEKMYNDMRVDIEVMKDNQTKEIAKLKEEHESHLKSHKSLNESFRRDLETDSSKKHNEDDINDDTFITSSMISNNIKSPEKHFQQLGKLRTALSKMLEVNKLLKSEISILESQLSMRCKADLYISDPLGIIKANKVLLVESEIQTNNNFLNELEESKDAHDLIEQLSNKVESLIFREIEMQSVINDLEFKLKCHKKFISEQL